ncbi:MAG: FKBP-type peptidyl-prolyl cis-trans isomerase [Candidatus Woesearchaeota archaeon]
MKKKEDAKKEEIKEKNQSKGSMNKKTPETAEITAKEGSLVEVSYTGTFDDGKVFDSVQEGFKFRIGSKSVLKPFEDAVIGMKPGQVKKIRIMPKDAYGERNDNYVASMPRNIFEGKVELEKGKRLVFTAPDGSRAYAEIKDFNDQDVVLDLNHPLAGKPLNFEIKLISVNE